LQQQANLIVETGTGGRGFKTVDAGSSVLVPRLASARPDAR
jgi:hypothetical protein